VRRRILGSVIVVFVGLVPAAMGGPVFALFMIALGAGGYREYLALVARVHTIDVSSSSKVGYAVIVAMAMVGLLSAGEAALFAVVALALIVPLLALLPQASRPGAFATWSLLSAGSLYLGLPVYAAVALRGLAGAVDAEWLSSLAQSLSWGWQAAPRGLGWALTAILATWIGDSMAYLSGRALGNKKLASSVSPGKTVAGAVGGLIGSMITSASLFVAFGLGPWWIGLTVGFSFGVAGQAGDLCESFMKRQAGVKDSGAIIPGHGGILDRIDALLFVFPASYTIAVGLERLGIT
jgi:phosphatidate cytidylyltransferase